MLELTTTTRMPFAFICIMGVTLVTTAFPHPRITLTSSDSSEVLKQDAWDIIFPSVALSDWTIQMLSAPSLRDDSKAGLKRGTWLLAPGRPEASAENSWPASFWSPAAAGVKRSVVADDAAFRERSKLLTSMERQKWLNSYMQKLLVVNASG